MAATPKAEFNKRKEAQLKAANLRKVTVWVQPEHETTVRAYDMRPLFKGVN